LGALERRQRQAKEEGAASLGTFFKASRKARKGGALSKRGANPKENCKAKLERSWLLYQVPLCYFLVAIFA
jgi:hypothetical protein